jgi:hypothetical protein
MRPEKLYLVDILEAWGTAISDVPKLWDQIADILATEFD